MRFPHVGTTVLGVAVSPSRTVAPDRRQIRMVVLAAVFKDEAGVVWPYPTPVAADFVGEHTSVESFSGCTSHAAGRRGVNRTRPGDLNPWPAGLNAYSNRSMQQRQSAQRTKANSA